MTIKIMNIKFYFFCISYTIKSCNVIKYFLSKTIIVINILRNNLPLLESISQKILQEEVIEGEDLKNLLAESKMPA